MAKTKKPTIVKGVVTIRKAYTGVPSRKRSGYQYGGRVRIPRKSEMEFISKKDIAQFDIIELEDPGVGPLIFKRKVGHLDH